MARASCSSPSLLVRSLSLHPVGTFPKFIECVGKQRLVDAAVLKAGRQWREEQASIKKNAKNTGKEKEAT